MSRPTGSPACPLCPQALPPERARKTSRRSCDSGNLDVPLLGRFLPDLGPASAGLLVARFGAVARVWVRRRRLCWPLPHPRKRAVRLTGSQSRLFPLLSISSASRAARLLSWSRRSTRQARRSTTCGRKSQSRQRAGAPRRSLRLRFRAATRAAAGSCRSSPPDDECPFRIADGAALARRNGRGASNPMENPSG
jgi:hypothetical protein